MSWTERQLDPDSQEMIDRITQPRNGGWVVDRPRAEAAIARHLQRLGIPEFPIRWASDGMQGYTAARIAGRSNLGMSLDPLWINKLNDIRANTRELVWNRIFTDTLELIRKRSWNETDAMIMSLILTNIDPSLRSAFRSSTPLSRMRRMPTIIEQGTEDGSVVNLVAQAVSWNALYAETGDERANVMAMALLPFLDVFEAGVWFCWIVDSKVILLPRPQVYLDDRQRFHRVDGPAIDWPEGEGLYFWNGVSVEANIVLNPERITVRMIDQERNAEVRRVMIERFGVERYLVEGHAEVIHRDHRGTLLRKDLPGDEPIVMIRVTNSTPEPDGTYKDYFIRVPPNMTNASVAVAWTFGIDPGEYYDPLKET